MLRKELPGDKEVAEGLFHAQVALKMSRGEEVSNLKFGGEVEAVSTLEQFEAAISLPGKASIFSSYGKLHAAVEIAFGQSNQHKFRVSDKKFTCYFLPMNLALLHAINSTTLNWST